ncbi:MAG: ACT domain-containing protein [Proteobacteria bacterium]|nr:ACT domain-containing protein [Pseudomonadota bacterium]
MLTVVGEDRAGIVAALTRALYEGGCHLGEATMMRLGGNFTIMMMVNGAADVAALERIITPVSENLQLRIHIDQIAARLHNHRQPNAQITVYGADRAGIIADVTGTLAEAGFDILDLNSDVAGTKDKPVYIMMIDGYIDGDVERLEHVLQPLRDNGIEATLTPLDTMMA